MAHPISTRRAGDNFIHSIGPDVCWTPMGSIEVPVPYYSIVFFDNSTRASHDVNDNELADFDLNTRAKGVTGHEPGTGKGIFVPGYCAFGGPKKSTSNIYTNGFQIVRDGDPAMINSPTEQAQEMQAPWINITLTKTEET
ncbi:DUF4150 domain-containing protein [Bartonella sp. HY329]|uniref:DUF4150 domain-containing protein n=1 Tax=unclassified Bartonella TaxID=2645622 RepID=UPI0021C87F8D|nr:MULTISPECIES: DUF4150 domain-containing protein [unclassified Bartonella]UXM96198.1 DUF4150 domain-containing protein [Bartonella sp. HY329]UXN10522.1 DUF4150 domain-containing protein [Bartonella sp. HY328]